MSNTLGVVTVIADKISTPNIERRAMKLARKSLRREWGDKPYVEDIRSYHHDADNPCGDEHDYPDEPHKHVTLYWEEPQEQEV